MSQNAANPVLFVVAGLVAFGGIFFYPDIHNRIVEMSRRWNEESLRQQERRTERALQEEKERQRQEQLKLAAVRDAAAELWAKEMVKDRLRDPESVRYRNVAAGPDGTHVCGYVNAKNSFGGYVGFMPFVVNLATRDVRVATNDDIRIVDNMLRTACGFR
jgi:hypothetical protein